MSAALLDRKESLDQLHSLAETIDLGSDDQIHAPARNSKSRILILKMRQTPQPWVQIMKQLARGDRRLENALKRTVRERHA